MDEYQKVIDLTEQLIVLAKEADAIYEEVRKDGREKDFYHEVKPFADRVQLACEQWEQRVKQWMKEAEFKHLFPQQIEQTAQNLTDVSVQAFFPKTSYKRFKSHVQSVLFILQNVKVESVRILAQKGKEDSSL